MYNIYSTLITFHLCKHNCWPNFYQLSIASYINNIIPSFVKKTSGTLFVLYSFCFYGNIFNGLCNIINLFLENVFSNRCIRYFFIWFFDSSIFSLSINHWLLASSTNPWSTACSTDPSPTNSLFTYLFAF